MKARGGYVQRKDGEWFDTERHHKLLCCDCGLVHMVDFRIRKGRIEMRATRDNRATAQVRRGKRQLASEQKGRNKNS